MAKSITDVKLQVRIENGTNLSGTAAVKNINLNQIKVTATDAELAAAGQAVANLQSHPLSEFRVVDTYVLTADN